jgi:hypothetical protein
MPGLIRKPTIGHVIKCQNVVPILDGLSRDLADRL